MRILDVHVLSFIVCGPPHEKGLICTQKCYWGGVSHARLKLLISKKQKIGNFDIIAFPDHTGTSTRIGGILMRDFDPLNVSPDWGIQQPPPPPPPPPKLAATRENMH